MFLSLRSKNLNAKIKEINVLLNFSRMFNMRPFACRGPSNAGANAVYKVSYAGFLTTRQTVVEAAAHLRLALHQWASDLR